MSIYNWPGVMGPPDPQRSVMDQRMHAIFASGTAEAYLSPVIGSGVDLGQRSVMDRWLQAQFNPFYQPKNVERYCGGGPSQTDPNWLIKNPNNPASSSVQYLPLN